MLCADRETSRVMIEEQVVIDDQTGSAGIRRNKGVVSHVEVDIMMGQRGRPADAPVRSSGKVAEDLVLRFAKDGSLGSPCRSRE